MDINDLAIVESHFIKMMFYPDAWAAVQNRSLVWHEISFPPNPRSIVPNQPGVYAFVVEPSLFSLAPANGLFYVGKATNLYQRISPYIRELSIQFVDSTRPHVWKMLRRWNGSMRYYYSVTNDVREAEEIEDDLINAFRPPFNKQYPAESSQVMRAFP